MRIATNPGSNLHPALVADYGLDLVPQEVCVDGIRHDTRAGIELHQIDSWVETARERPIVLGTSAIQLATYFVEIAKEDREILFLASSRKIVGTYAAAQAAAKTLSRDRRYADLDIRLVDTGLTDIGAAVPVLLAAEARRAGRTLDEVEALAKGFCGAGRMAIFVSSLDGLIQGGRATFLQGWIANLLRVRPILGFEDGELSAISRVSTKSDEVRALAKHLSNALGTRKVWAGVGHGNDPGRRERLLEALHEVFDLEYVYAVPTSPSIYLHTSAGSVSAAVFPAPDDVSTPPALPPS